MVVVDQDGLAETVAMVVAGISGSSGSGAGAGTGAIRVSDGQLTATGELPSGTSGGKIESCTTGIYWSRQGKSPCEDVGSTTWRDFNGDEVSQGPTATITRGYKSSDEVLYGYRNNGGNSSTSRGTFVGGGGASARGGNATTSASGGGGRSTYTSGDVVIVDSRQGGNSSNRS